MTVPMALEGQVGLRRGSLAIEVDLAVPAGQTLAIVGPNGAGKSSVLLAVAGALALDSGELSIAGQLVDASPATFVPSEHRGVSMVFHDPLLFPHLSALDNVAFGPRSRGVSRQTAATVARDWLERLGVGALSDRRPDALSGGESQRVALARALAVSPSLLLLDEPLAALDVEVHDAVRADLAAHTRELGIAVVLVTHSLHDVEALADTVLVLEGGRASQQGTLATLALDPATDFVRRFVHAR